MLTRTPADIREHPSRDAIRRDPRLDVFRGLGMFIIFIAHVPFDEWALWIPARFGFSDATEIFVFLSGMASALAFGKLFDRKGFASLAGRIALRIWQIYWAHIGLFVATAALMALAGMRPDGVSYIESLNLDPFFRDPATLLPDLLMLRYVPNYFDILPMYLVLVALLPLMLLAERAHRHLPLLLMAGLWLTAQTGLLDMSAEPWSPRPWFFNPFGWQLLFFIGFFIMRGTIPLPRSRPALLWAAGLVIAAAVPLSWYLVLDNTPVLKQAAQDLLPLTDKSRFGILRLVHFMALALIASQVVGENGRRLKGWPVAVLRKVGQQSLAVFIGSMFAAQVAGMALDHAGRGPLPTLAVNLAGFALLLGIAMLAAWFKAAPWKAA